MALSRKERRALAHDRKLRGLPPAKPWQHTKERRVRSITEMMHQQDLELAKELHIPVRMVKIIRSRSQGVLNPPETVVESN